MEKIEFEKEKLVKVLRENPGLLKTLVEHFPEIKDEVVYYDLTPLTFKVSDYYIFSREQSIEAGFRNEEFMQVRRNGTYAYKSFFLSSEYNWELLKDEEGALVLLPTMKLKSEE
jgi:hypothetical protein